MKAATGFDEFWSAYPKRVAKGAARRIWARINPSPELVQKMIQALAWQRTQPQWLKDGGQFIPNASTYLHQERWEDEPVVVSAGHTQGRGLNTFLIGEP